MDLARKFSAKDIYAVVGNNGVLGQGGFGCVRLCKYRSLGYVAVKCCTIIGGMNHIRDCKACVERELNAVMQAHHPNIVTVHGVTRWDANLGIVMEYLPGGNLYELMTCCDHHIPYVVRLRLCNDVGNGLSCLHNLNADTRIVHGDLKPQNCLLTRDLCCKLADFGSAQISGYTGQIGRILTPSKRIPHTYIYLAPEKVAEPNARYTTSMDVYSYGLVVFFVLVSSQIPIQDQVDFFAYAQSFIVHLPTSEGKIATFLADIMKATLHKLPHERPVMPSVTDHLYNYLSQFDQSLISNGVAETLQSYPIHLPPADQLFRPLSQMPVLYAQRFTGSDADLGTDIQSLITDDDSADPPPRSHRSLPSSNEQAASNVGVNIKSSSRIAEESPAGDSPIPQPATDDVEKEPRDDDVHETRPKLVRSVSASSDPANNPMPALCFLVGDASAVEDQQDEASTEVQVDTDFSWGIAEEKEVLQSTSSGSQHGPNGEVLSASDPGQQTLSPPVNVNFANGGDAGQPVARNISGLDDRGFVERTKAQFELIREGQVHAKSRSTAISFDEPSSQPVVLDPVSIQLAAEPHHERESPPTVSSLPGPILASATRMGLLQRSQDEPDDDHLAFDHDVTVDQPTTASILCHDGVTDDLNQFAIISGMRESGDDVTQPVHATVSHLDDVTNTTNPRQREKYPDQPHSDGAVCGQLLQIRNQPKKKERAMSSVFVYTCILCILVCPAAYVYVCTYTERLTIGDETTKQLPKIDDKMQHLENGGKWTKEQPEDGGRRRVEDIGIGSRWDILCSFIYILSWVYLLYAHKDATLELTKEMQRARDLVPAYEAAACANEQEKCDEIVAHLTATLLENKDADPDKLHAFADNQLDEENFLAAVLFYRIAANFEERVNQGGGIGNCCVGIQVAALTMIEQKAPGSHQLAKNHVIPVITSLREKIDRPDVDNEQRAARELHCTSCVVSILLELGEHRNVVEAGQLGLQRFESNLPRASCMEYLQYGSLSHDIAGGYCRLSKWDLAIQFYQQAVTAKKSATNYSSKGEKRRAIECSERELKKAQNRRN